MGPTHKGSLTSDPKPRSAHSVFRLSMDPTLPHELEVFSGTAI